MLLWALTCASFLGCTSFLGFRIVEYTSSVLTCEETLKLLLDSSTDNLLPRPWAWAWAAFSAISLSICFFCWFNSAILIASSFFCRNMSFWYLKHYNLSPSNCGSFCRVIQHSSHFLYDTTSTLKRYWNFTVTKFPKVPASDVDHNNRAMKFIISIILTRIIKPSTLTSPVTLYKTKGLSPNLTL